MSVNRVVLVGRLTRNPELRTTTTGKNVASFGIAVDRRVKGEADFFTVTCWNQTADYVTNYLTKGRLVAVDGRLSWRKYTTSDGQNREVVEVVADSVQGLDRPREDDGDGSAPSRSYPSATDGGSSSAPAAAAPDEYDPFADN